MRWCLDNCPFPDYVAVAENGSLIMDLYNDWFYHPERFAELETGGIPSKYNE